MNKLNFGQTNMDFETIYLFARIWMNKATMKV